MPGTEATIVRRLAREMTRLERLVVSLHYADGLTLMEIAAVLDRTETEIAAIVSGVVDRVRGTVPAC